MPRNAGDHQVSCRVTETTSPTSSCGHLTALDIDVTSPLQQLTLSEASGHDSILPQGGATSLPPFFTRGLHPRCWGGGGCKEAVNTICSLHQAVVNCWTLPTTTRHLLPALRGSNTCLWLHHNPNLTWMEHPDTILTPPFPVLAINNA